MPDPSSSIVSTEDLRIALAAAVGFGQMLSDRATDALNHADRTNDILLREVYTAVAKNYHGEAERISAATKRLYAQLQSTNGGEPA